jgi:hypothetical protein
LTLLPTVKPTVASPPPDALPRVIQLTSPAAVHPHVPDVRVMVRLSCWKPWLRLSLPAGDTVYAHGPPPPLPPPPPPPPPGFRSAMSARAVPGTVTFCSPPSYPAAEARIRNVSAVNPASAYAPAPSVVAALPAFEPFKASTRAPARPAPVAPSVMTPVSVDVTGGRLPSGGIVAELVAVEVVAAVSAYVTVARTDCANACDALASVVTSSRVSAVPFAGHTLAVAGSTCS